MADIFFSYAKVDRDRVQPLIEALETEWSVWWDDDLTTGESWSAEILAELNQARCAVVAWTQASINSDFVLDEARRAHKVRKLIPVMFDLVELPMGFGGLQAADFSRWGNDPKAAEFVKLAQAIRRRLNSAAPAAPAGVVPIRADRPEASPVVQTRDSPAGQLPSPLPGKASVEDKPRFGQTAWIIIAAITSIVGAGIGYRIYGIDDIPTVPSAAPTPPIATPAPSPTAQPAANGYTAYLHTKRPDQQIDALTRKLKGAGYDVASPDKDADNDSGNASPRSGVDYPTRGDAAKNRDAAEKAAGIANELLGTDIKPRPQSAVPTGKLGIWLPYMGDYNVTIHFAGVFNRKDEIIPFAQKLRSVGWRVQEPTAGGGERDEAAAKLCEVRYRVNDDRAFAELLAAEVPKTGIAPGRPSVKLDKVGAGELQLWIGSGICK